ncbi:MAG: F0F1 ATP synthase subunit B [Nocardioidaceae bacterium]|nr:F0F1 ATP synthase subunit B [Nocardioidaceae bacterium]
MVTSVGSAVPLESNFLVPNGTFFVELAAFAIMVWILAKFVIPPINKAMTARQNAIRKEFADLETAQEDARKAEKEYKDQLADARHEAAKIREDAREQGAAIVAEMRKQAQQESERILKHGRSQLEAERAQAVASLRTEVGSMATALAGRIVGESLEDDDRRARTVERFIASLEEENRAATNGSGAS